MISAVEKVFCPAAGAAEDIGVCVVVLETAVQSFRPKNHKNFFFSPQRHIILILLIRNSIFDRTNRFPFSEFKNN